MIKETKIINAFNKFVKKFDMNKGNVKALYFHSLKMMDLCKNIASELGVFNEGWYDIVISFIETARK